MLLKRLVPAWMAKNKLLLPRWDRASRVGNNLSGGQDTIFTQVYDLLSVGP